MSTYRAQVSRTNDLRGRMDGCRTQVPPPFGHRTRESTRGFAPSGLLSGNSQTPLADPYGLIHAQDPPEALVEVMFELAGTLGAGVYSERLKRYESVTDWRKRTQRYRVSQAAAGERRKRQRRLRLTLWTLLVLLSISAGWLSPSTRAHSLLSSASGGIDMTAEGKCGLTSRSRPTRNSPSTL